MTFIFKVNVLKCSLKNTEVNSRLDGRKSMNLVLERCILSSKKGREQPAPQCKNAVASSEPNIIKTYTQPSQVMCEKKHIYLNEVCIFVRMSIISSQSQLMSYCQMHSINDRTEAELIGKEDRTTWSGKEMQIDSQINKNILSQREIQDNTHQILNPNPRNKGQR